MARPCIPYSGRGGASSAAAGAAYERVVYDVTRRIKPKHASHFFNTQSLHELGGSSSGHDIICNWNKSFDCPIEIKKRTAMDWMQCSLYYENGVWRPTRNGKNNKNCRELMGSLVSGETLFGGLVPPFMSESMTYERWLKYRKDYPTQFFTIPDEVISELYRLKGSKYLQIGYYGLYKTSEVDFCDFGVPRFSCETVMRVRVKVHCKRTCKLSVVISPFPIGLQNLPASSASLDSFFGLPSNFRC